MYILERNGVQRRYDRYRAFWLKHPEWGMLITEVINGKIITDDLSKRWKSNTEARADWTRHLKLGYKKVQ